jgi:hypothetical protein
MIKWIDIASPTLRKVHQAWLSFRGSRLMAHVSDYNKFLGYAPAELSLSVILPGDGSGPVIKHAGTAVQDAFPFLRSGLRFDEIASPVYRTNIATPFHKVASARQPDSRRSSWRSPEEVVNFEQLLLPFDNDHLSVRVVHAVFELGRVERIAA